MKIGIIREGKIPPDKRVPLIPKQCTQIIESHPQISICVQPSNIRAYSDSEYQKEGITLKEDLTDCDILMGVKEVPINMLIPEKTYFFFSHTIKKQLHNRELLKSILAKKIRLVDWETLVNENHQRVIAFGRYAGIVGAYNGILTYGKRYNLFYLKPAHQCFDMEEMKGEYKKLKLPNIKIVLTGAGRVSSGAVEVLDGMGIKKVSTEDYLTQNFNEAVYTQIDTHDYNIKSDGTYNRDEFYKNPIGYQSNFLRFAKVSDMLIAGAFWSPEAPKLFTKEDTKSPDFKIKVIADVTMDIEGSVSTTIKAATIAEPCYDFNPQTGMLEPAFSSEQNITEMAVDNLPCELPRDASRDFGKQFIENVLPNLIGNDIHGMIDGASITNFEGQLTQKFSYLEDYAY